MGRNTVCTISAGLLLLLVSCHASTRATKKADSNCVSVGAKYGRGRDSNVATCGLAETIQKSTERLQQRLMDVEDSTGGLIEEQQGKIEALQGDVASLQGSDSALRPLYAGFFFFGQFVPIRICEINTYSEAMELARLAFGDENPNVHWVHLPCQDDCPLGGGLRFIPGCYRPNNLPSETPFVSTIFDCVEIPTLEECTRVVFITNQGYTPNVDRDAMLSIDLFGGSTVGMEGIPESMRNVAERVSSLRDGQ